MKQPFSLRSITRLGLALMPLASVSASLAAAQDAAPEEGPFPASTAIAEGVSPESLASLDQLIQKLVDDDDIVGGELLVIKNGRTILHEAYGLNDREAQTPLETGSVFCVRSMTKPLISTSILMLIEEDALELDDSIAQYLPSWDIEGSRDITIENLLAHTSGLPMSLLLSKNLRKLDGIQAVAELGAGYKLDFKPGTSFNYSDQGTDTLTALIEVVSDMTAAEFVRTRILEPLNMQHTTCVMSAGHPLRERGCSKYMGGRGAWTRFWNTEDPELFPFFLGSQGLYSTLEDYARFMEFWRRKGRSDSGRLLGARYARKALVPCEHPFPGSSGLPGLKSAYGYLMQLWTGPGKEKKDGSVGERKVVAFGHTGSDGTHAWVFPAQKAMVFYFTQSRGTTSGLRVEEALGELFLGVPYDPATDAPPREEYLGYYWEGAGDLYRAIVKDGEDMSLEVMGRAVAALSYVGEDRWKLRDEPSTVLAFKRDEAGQVTGFSIGTHNEYRFDPSADLPTVDEIAERVAGVHRYDLLETLGPLRMSGELVMETVGVKGETSTLLAWPDRFRVDFSNGEQFERVAFDGEHVRTVNHMQPLKQLEGVREELTRRDNPFFRFGDWRDVYPKLEVIQKMVQQGKEIFLVRAGDTSAPGLTLYVDWSTGRVMREDSLVYVEGMGRMGQRTTFGDFRDVSGILLPHKFVVQYPSPLLGKAVTTMTKVELGVEVPEGTFELKD